jgi:NAD-dependent deacetylase
MENCKKVAEYLLSSTYAIVFTGAGISTASGIPDFRGPQGLWKKYSPELATIDYFKRDPKGFWEFYSLRMRPLFEATPNPAHYAISELEKMGIIKAVITQNIDGLHQKAGSKYVIELHGTMSRSICTSCSTVYDSKEVLNMIENGKIPPKCKACNGILKPDVVLFGEPVQRIWEAFVIAEESDLVLAIGSSLSVYPANMVPYRVKQKGGRLIIINAEPTEMDEIADLVVRDRVEVFLPCIVDEIKKEMKEGSDNYNL